MAQQMRRDLLESRPAEVFTFPAVCPLEWQAGTELNADEGFWRRSRAKRLSLLQVGVGLCVADFFTSLLAELLGSAVFANVAADLDVFGHILFWAAPVLTVCAFYERGFYSRRAILQPVGLRQVALGWLHASGLLLLTAAAWSTVTTWRGGQGGVATAFAGLGGLWALAFLAGGFSGFIATRMLWSAMRKHLVGRFLVYGRAVVVGTGPDAEQVINRLRGDPASGLDVVGVLDDETPGECASLCGVAVLGGVQDMAGVVRYSGADTVIVALPWTAVARIASALAEAGRLPVETRLAPDAAAQDHLRHPLGSVAGQLLFDVRDPPLSGAKAVVKRAEDLVLASVILLVLSPALLAVAVAIKLDSRGPVIFKQPRRGFNNRVFNLYKFRSMHAHTADEACMRQTSRGDPRLTRMGAFLRRHSIDELPQFLNVLRGEMSIVGPRPHALSTRTEGLLLEDAADSYIARFRVRPGITGWAQVNGWRGELDTREKLERRVEFDLDYVERWSLLMDLRIIWLTLGCMIRDCHAY